MSRKKTTLWNVFFFYLRNIIAFINGILIVPLYLKFIEPNLFGAWLASGNILTWITLVDPGVGDVLTQKVSVVFGKKKLEILNYLIPSAFIISLTVSILGLLLSIVLSNYVETILNVSKSVNMTELLKAFQINAIATSLTLFSFCLSGTLLGFQKTKEIGIILTFSGLLGILINVLLLYNNFGLMSISYANLVKSSVSISLYAWLLITIFKRKKIHFKFRKKYFISFSKVFSYTFASKIFSTVASNIDLILVSRFTGPSSVIILELTRRPIKVVQGLVNIPSVSMLPAFSNLYGEGDVIKMKSIIKRFLTIFSWILFFFISGFVVFNRELISIWVGSKFYIGDTNNLIICLTFFLITLTYNLSNFSYSMGNIKGNSLMDIVKNCLYLILLLSLGHFFGMRGILLASLLSILLSEFWYYPYKVFRLANFKFKEIRDIRFNFVFLLAISIILSTVFKLINSGNISSLILKAILFTLTYFTLLYFFINGFKKELYQLINSILFKNKKNEKIT